MSLLREENPPASRLVKSGVEDRYKGWAAPVGTRIRRGQRILVVDIVGRRAISQEY
jgi:hypothetical protein